MMICSLISAQLIDRGTFQLLFSLKTECDEAVTALKFSLIGKFSFGKPNNEVVLDLDETLVCAYETSSLPALLRSQATEAGIKWFELECISCNMNVTVFERPGLKEFLKQLSEFAELVLFTAGPEGYARPLVDRIDAGNRFSRRLCPPTTSMQD